MEKARPFKIRSPGGLRDHTGQYSESGKPAPRSPANLDAEFRGNPPSPTDARVGVGGPCHEYGKPSPERKPFKLGG